MKRFYFADSEFLAWVLVNLLLFSVDLCLWRIGAMEGFFSLSVY